MKKTTKRLALSKETLRDLEHLDLVAGQGITQSDVNSCIGTCGSAYLSCQLSRNNCGSAYC